MAQAETIPTTSRRNFLSIVGAAGAAIAVPSIASAASPIEGHVSEELIVLGRELRAAHATWIDCSDNLRDVVAAKKEWEDRNEIPRHVDAAGGLIENQSELVQEHLARKTKVVKQIGLRGALAGHHAASVAFLAAVQGVAWFEAKSIADLRLKAELAFECDNDENFIASTVVEDFLEMMRPEAVA